MEGGERKELMFVLLTVKHSIASLQSPHSQLRHTKRVNFQ